MTSARHDPTRLATRTTRVLPGGWHRAVVVAGLLGIAGSAGAARRDPSSNTIEVPFTLVRDSIVVQVRVAGHGPFDMLFDTGVDPSVVDLAAAKAMGLKVSSTGGRGSGGGNDTNLAYETRLPLVDLGALTARNVAALATDLSKTGDALGRPISGVLGYSLLRNRIVQIDYPHRVVRFLRRAPEPEPGRTVVSFRYRDEILIDDFEVNGVKVIANLDTGSNATFQMAPVTVAALKLEQEAMRGEPTRSVGFNGSSEHRRGSLRQVALGDLVVDDAPVVYLGRNTGHDDEAWGVRIGNGFLEAFVVTIDYRSRHITLERPRAGTNTAVRPPSDRPAARSR